MLTGNPEVASRLARGGGRMVERRFNMEKNMKVLVHLLMSATRGERRWSVNKLRERVGVEPLPEEV